MRRWSINILFIELFEIHEITFQGLSLSYIGIAALTARNADTRIAGERVKDCSIFRKLT